MTEFQANNLDLAVHQHVQTLSKQKALGKYWIRFVVLFILLCICTITIPIILVKFVLTSPSSTITPTFKLLYVYVLSPFSCAWARIYVRMDNSSGGGTVNLTLPWPGSSTFETTIDGVIWCALPQALRISDTASNHTSVIVYTQMNVFQQNDSFVSSRCNVEWSTCFLSWCTETGCDVVSPFSTVTKTPSLSAQPFVTATTTTSTTLMPPSSHVLPTLRPWINHGKTPSPRPQWPGAGTSVQLLEWQWVDIALECAAFLGPKGYKAVQVSQPLPHKWNTKYSWYLRYQPVDFTVLNSRSGTHDQFVMMTNECFAAGVDIMVDVVINHLAGSRGNDCRTVLNSWSYRHNNSGTQFVPCSLQPTYRLFSERDDFHNYGQNPEPTVSNSDDCWQARYYDLSGLQDLNTDCGTLASPSAGCDSTYGTSCRVRNIHSKYLHSLLCLGVRSFRIDAALHVAPNDIWTLVDNAVSWANATNGCVQGAGFGPGNSEWGGNDRVWKSATQIDPGFFPFVYNEVYDGNTGRLPNRYVREFDNNGSRWWVYASDFDSSYNIWNSFRTSNIAWIVTNVNNDVHPGGSDSGAQHSTRSENTLVFTDNHDIQRSTWNQVMTNWVGKDAYTNANSLLLAFPYGAAMLMSSYTWEGAEMGLNTDFGPPSDAWGNTNFIWNVEVDESGSRMWRNTECGKPLAARHTTGTKKGLDWNLDVEGGWVCEHRWQGIANMVMWRNVVSAGNWELHHVISGNSNAGVAFVRDGDKTLCSFTERCNVGALYAVNNHPTSSWNITSWFVGLPDGTYCNIATSDCDSAPSFQIRRGYLLQLDGTSTITVPSMSFIATHTDARL